MILCLGTRFPGSNTFRHPAPHLTSPHPGHLSSHLTSLRSPLISRKEIVKIIKIIEIMKFIKITKIMKIMKIMKIIPPQRLLYRASPLGEFHAARPELFLIVTPRWVEEEEKEEVEEQVKE